MAEDGVVGLPSISVVTPSLNQGRFLEPCMRSILDQGYPDLEYMVVDGGSTDGSAEIIERYAGRLSWSVSEPDQGQYDAINKGMAKTSGEVMAWLNSDDMYVPGALSVVGEVFARFPEVEWITSLFPIRWNESGQAIGCYQRVGFDRRAFLRGSNLVGRGWRATHWIQQESTFWRRSLWERAGGRVDANLTMAGDFDLWCRFYRHAELYGVSALIGGLRRHGEQKTALRFDDYLDEAEASLKLAGGRPYGRLESKVHARLGRSILNPRLRGIGLRLGLLYPANQIYNDGPGRWSIRTAYFH